MNSDEDYSIINVVRHLKYFIQTVYGDNYLVLQYKLAKPNQETKGNIKFDNILKNSFKQPIVMNANRQMKKKQYVHLKSMAHPNQFKFFKQNIKTLQKLKSLQISCSEKVDLSLPPQKISFDLQMQKWIFKNKRILFKPSYQTVYKQNLFRISLYSEQKGYHQPKRKVMDMLEQALNRAMNVQKQDLPTIKQKHQMSYNPKKTETTNANYKGYQNKKLQGFKEIKQSYQAPLRFKNEQKIELNQCCFIVMSKVYQVVNIKLYQSIKELIKLNKTSSDKQIGKMLLSNMISDILKDFQEELSYEVELRFTPLFLQYFEELDEDLIQDIMVKAADVFLQLAKDPKQFSGQAVVNKLQFMEGE